ncbi:MAG: type II toxin-antitoxin system RelE/ParE family toxin [Bryobacteraceae bacterium]
MSAYQLTPAAEDDLDELWAFIAADSPAAADRVEQELFATFDHLATMPGIGRRRTDWTDKPVLFFPAGNYLIVYRDTNPLQIVRVLHGARQIPAILRSI